jgi:transcriptional accessory protein Tex/SPT6
MFSVFVPRTFRLGKTVEVRIMAVDPVTKQVILTLKNAASNDKASTDSSNSMNSLERTDIAKLAARSPTHWILAVVQNARATSLEVRCEGSSAIGMI